MIASTAEGRMSAINVIGIPLFVLFVASLIGVVVGVFAKKTRLWRISLWVLAGVSVVYMALTLIFG